MHTRQNLAVSFVLAISMVGIGYGADGILPGDGLSESTAYLIEDLADFDVFASNSSYRLSGVYTKLVFDINLAGRRYTTAVIAPDTSTSSGFQGISFRGIFDGNGHIVSNLTIYTARVSNDYLGLFGVIEGTTAEVKNLGLENVNITGGHNSWCLGGLCGSNGDGYVYGGTITNCYAIGSVTGGTYSHYLGGLCGMNEEDGIISNCYATGLVTGGYYSRYLGGLCGMNEEDGIISNCYTSGSVIGGTHSWYIGGLCGYNNYGSIINCYATGKVTCEYGYDVIQNHGGLCGLNRGNISNCYATGKVTGGYFLENRGGLCGSNTGSISDCYATGNVFGDNKVGGLCGYNSGSISNCYAIGSVNGKADSESLGGLCGYNNTGSIGNCYSSGSVTGGADSERLGGLCGYSYRGSISNCYATGSVTGNDYLGGLCGYNYSGSISNCYATGLVTGNDYLGGLCYGSGSISNCYFLDSAGPDNGLGTPLTDSEMKQQSSFVGWDCNPRDGDPADWFMSPLNYPRLSWQQTIVYYGQTKIFLNKGDPGCSIQIDVYSQIDQALNWTITGQESCSWITNLSPDSGVSTGPTDLTTVNIDINTATLTCGRYVCELILNADNGDNVILLLRLHILLAGSGTQANPFLIEDFDGFQDFADSANASIYWTSGIYARLECNLDLNPNLVGRQIYTTAIIAPNTSSSSIYQGTPFTGVFDGDGHVIRNLTIDATGDPNDYLGLFGKIDDPNTEVKNLGIENINITGGSDYLGGLCGYNDEGTITNCYAAGSVTGGSDSDYLGGLCGYNRYGTITDCYATGSVTGSNCLGGLCGYNYEGTITNCYATGSVSGYSYLGGLCGGNYEGTITNCYAIGSVSGYSYLGGLSGSNGGTISNCYATGEVTGDDYLGGLCGRNGYGTITNCYAIGSISSGPDSKNIGGLVGYSSGTVTNGFYLKYTAQHYRYGTALSLEQMTDQNSFSGWDFNGIWKMEAGDYPSLFWQTETNQVPNVIGLDVSDAKVQLNGSGFVGNLYYTYHDTLPVGIVTKQSPLPDSIAVLGRAVNLWISAGLSPYSGGDGLTPETALRISSPADLITLSDHPEDWDKYIVLTADIDLTGYTLTTALIAPDTDNTNHALFDGISFTGSFDGMDPNIGIVHTISNLTIDTAGVGNDFIALFGYAERATIKNLRLENLTITATGTEYNNNRYIGGLVGSSSGTITKCYVAGSVTGGPYIGGMVGHSLGTIINCYTDCIISGTYNSGGLVGRQSSGTISKCYATGSVTGGWNSQYIGGLVGVQEYDSSQITNCYAIGSVTGGWDGKYIGGLMGGQFGGAIANCYATGNVSGGSSSIYRGGLIGKSSGIVNNSNSFWDIQTTGQTISAGGEGVTGLDTAAMQDINTFLNAGWDFIEETANGADDIWWMPPDRYPLLDWQGIYVESTLIAREAYYGRIPDIHYLDIYAVTDGIYWEFAETCSWVDIIPQAGISSGESNEVEIVFQTGDLLPGVHNCNLEIHSDYNLNIPLIVPVQLNVIGPEIELSTSSLSFAAYYNCNNPDDQTFTIGNANEALMNWQITADPCCSWLAVEPVSGTSEDGPDEVTVSVDVSGLDIGRYECDVIVSDPYAQNNPQIVQVTLLVSPFENGDGSPEHPFEISTPEMFTFLGPNYELYDKYFVLTDDLDLSGINSSEYHPIGSFSPFTGTFDGNGHAISNLNIEIEYGYAGIFGFVSGENARIENLRLDNITINSMDSRDVHDPGSLVACLQSGTVSNCHVTSGDITGYYNAGGLIGFNVEGHIEYCSFEGAVSGQYGLGGLCGHNKYGTITNCYTTGSVTGGDNSDYLGGLCGYNYFGTITNCYTTGAVTGGDNSGRLGGLCGSNSYGTINNCYSTGPVTGDNYLGGLCGINSYGIITGCYSGGSVTGGDNSDSLGGLCGYNNGGTITNCFWDVETSGISISYGGTGKTTIQMQTESTFTDANWDFSVVPVWHMPFEAIGYPMLGWQKDIPGDFTGRYGVYMDDFAVLSDAWLSDNAPTANWNEHCDLNGNGVIDPGDLRTFAEHWLCD
ncbi:MAG: PASTA domain-containing protein [Sedimentisphaerales bacterium]|nr:PASTA domain-containing protein [Sedimentisphaerales bacterium]